MTGADCVKRFSDALALCNADRLPVYLSVDKDVLHQEESPGDWDNGAMSMVQVGAMLDHLVRSYRITGADVTGERGGSFYYEYRPVKNIISWIEHRACRNSMPLISANAKQRAVNLDLMNIMGVQRVD